jgi:hypothetical protein
LNFVQERIRRNWLDENAISTGIASAIQFRGPLLGHHDKNRHRASERIASEQFAQWVAVKERKLR